MQLVEVRRRVMLCASAHVHRRTPRVLELELELQLVLVLVLALVLVLVLVLELELVLVLVLELELELEPTTMNTRTTNSSQNRPRAALPTTTLTWQQPLRPNTYSACPQPWMKPLPQRQAPSPRRPVTHSSRQCRRSAASVGVCCHRELTQHRRPVPALARLVRRLRSARLLALPPIQHR